MNESWKELNNNILQEVGNGGTQGITVKEYCSKYATQTYHGPASGKFSNLHKNKLIERLEDRRNGFSIYVLPEFTNNRKTVPHKSGSK